VTGVQTCALPIWRLLVVGICRLFPLLVLQIGLRDRSIPRRDRLRRRLWFLQPGPCYELPRCKGVLRELRGWLRLLPKRQRRDRQEKASEAIRRSIHSAPLRKTKPLVNGCAIRWPGQPFMAQHLPNLMADGTRSFYTVYNSFTCAYPVKSIECSL
jgi:hypothetical protein